MKRHWEFSRHYAERALLRIDSPKEFSRSLANRLNNEVLQLVFECHLNGNVGRRLYHEGMRIGYTWDENKRAIVIQTVY